MYSALSGVSLLFWMSPHLNILCTSSEKSYYRRIPTDSSMREARYIEVRGCHCHDRGKYVVIRQKMPATVTGISSHFSVTRSWPRHVSRCGGEFNYKKKLRNCVCVVDSDTLQRGTRPGGERPTCGHPPRSSVSERSEPAFVTAVAVRRFDVCRQRRSWTEISTGPNFLTVGQISQKFFHR